MSNALNQREKIALRKRAHALKPVILTGNLGLTDAVQMEIDRALEAHELIKIRLNNNDKQARQAMIDAICAYQHATVIQIIGKIVAIYRPRQKQQS